MTLTVTSATVFFVEELKRMLGVLATVASEPKRSYKGKETMLSCFSPDHERIKIS